MARDIPEKGYPLLKKLFWSKSMKNIFIRKRRAQSGLRRARTLETIFYVCVIAVPLINFVFLQFYQNYVDVFIYSIKTFDFETSTFGIHWDNLFFNFENFISAALTEPLWTAAFKNALISSLVSWAAFPINMIVPLYLSKKYFGHKAMKFMLLLPSMLPGMVSTLIEKLLLDRAFPTLFGWDLGLLANVETRFWTLQIKGIWGGVASGVILYTGLYSAIDQSMIEAGKMDGLTFFGEWWYIDMPLTYPVWSLGFVTFFNGFFSGGTGLVEWFGYTAGAEVAQPGYILFTKVMNSTGDIYADYGFNCAGAIIFTFIVLPITMVVKRIVENHGPSEDDRSSVKLKKNKFKEVYNANFK